MRSESGTPSKLLNLVSIGLSELNLRLLTPGPGAENTLVGGLEADFAFKLRVTGQTGSDGTAELFEDGKLEGLPAVMLQGPDLIAGPASPRGASTEAPMVAHLLEASSDASSEAADLSRRPS